MNETETLKNDAAIAIGAPAQFQRAPSGTAASGTATLKNRRKPLLALFLLVIVLILGGGVGWYLRRNHTTPGVFVTLFGNIDIREVAPAFNDSGRIVAMLAQEGDKVKAGELIATMDDTRFAAGLAQAEGQARNQEQVLARLKNGSRPEEIAQAKATMDALAATYQNDEANYRRAAMLVETKAGTVQQRDNAKAAYDASRQQYEAAKQAYVLAVAGPRKEDIAAAEAMLEADRGAAALAKRELQDTKLFAPSDGIVENRILEPGDMASPTTPVYTVALTNPLWVRAYVAESDLGRIALGMRAEARTDSFPGKVYHGWVGYISPAAEFTPKNVETPQLRTALVYQVRVYVCDARNELRLGMPATVQVDLSRPPPEKSGGKDAGPHSCGAQDGSR